MANLVAIQMNSSELVQDNLRFVEQQLKMLPPERPCLLVLPECFACFGGKDKGVKLDATDEKKLKKLLDEQP